MTEPSVIKRSRRRRGGQRRDVYTHPSQVPGVISRARSGGRIKQGPRLGRKLKKGAMNKIAFKLGYIDHGQTISDIPKSKMDDFARDLVKTVGIGRARKMVNVQLVFRKNSTDGFKDKMLIAKNAIHQESKILKVRR